MRCTDRLQPTADFARKGGGRPKLVETNVEADADLAGNNIGRGIADINADDFEVRRIEIGRARVERRRQQRVKRPRQRASRIVGEMWIGDVPLLSDQSQAACQGAASSVLDRIAQVKNTGGFAEHAMIYLLAPVASPFDQFGCAIDGRPLLIAGKQECYRTVGRTRRHETQDRSDRSRNTPLHVRGAPSP